jgi:hypothetical protein
MYSLTQFLENVLKYLVCVFVNSWKLFHGFEGKRFQKEADTTELSHANKPIKIQLPVLSAIL